MSLRAKLRIQHADFEGREGVFSNLDIAKKELIHAHARQHSFAFTPPSSISSSSQFSSTSSRSSLSSTSSSPASLSATVPTAAAADTGSSPTMACYWQPKQVWYRYQTTVPELTACVLALLSITATEAAVERSFSAQGTVHTKKRNRLLNSSVEREMFIKFNLRLLSTEEAGTKKYMMHGTCVEIDEHYEEVRSSAKDEQSLFTDSPDSDSEDDADEADRLIRSLVSDGKDNNDSEQESDGETEQLREESSAMEQQSDDQGRGHDDVIEAMRSDDKEPPSVSPPSGAFASVDPEAEVLSAARSEASPPVSQLTAATRSRRKHRPMLKPQRRTAAAAAVAEQRADTAAAFGPPRSRRSAPQTMMATDSDVRSFVDCYSEVMNITTAWQWNGDKENALEQAAIHYTPPIRTLVATLKMMLEERAKHIVALGR